MVKATYEHVNKITKRLADGSRRIYYYHRGTGQKIEGELGSAEFALSYTKAARRAVEVKQAIFQTLIGDYFGSASFASLGDRTRADYLKHRPVIEDTFSTLPLEALKDKRVKSVFRKWRDGLAAAKGARQADLIFATCRRIVSFGVDDGLIEVNHLLTIDAVYKADRSDMIWLPEHIEAFFENAPAGMRLALILALNLGRREGDLIRLTWGDFAGDYMAVTNRKSRRALKFPARVTEALRASLDAYKRSLGRIPHKGETILTTPGGSAWTESHFSTKFSAAKNEAGLRELHFHDLRGTAVTILAENGATGPEIAAITGHSLKNVEAILDKYMSRTRALNDAATKKLEESWIAQFSIR